MNSEKVKEIKKALEDLDMICYEKTCLDRINKISKYINELESENERLILQYERVKADNEMNCLELKDRIVELESELEKEQINNLNCDTELQYKEKRIAELEKQVCGNEELHTLVEKLNYMTILKKFAEKVKDSLEEYRLENEYFTEHEPNGNLWQMNASVFCIEVTQDGGLIDQLAKECLNEFAKDLKINYGKI